MWENHGSVGKSGTGKGEAGALGAEAGGEAGAVFPHGGHFLLLFAVELLLAYS